MAHLVNAECEYRLLQQRLDRQVIGAPESPTFTRILQLLFSPEDARLARQLPTWPTPLDVLAGRLAIPENELGDKIAELARRGLVIDLEHRGRRYAAMPSVLLGFCEFVFMRARNDVPMADLSRLFEQYLHEDDRLMGSIFDGTTQAGRALAREESLPQEDHVEVCDWERASRIVQSASAIGVSLCMCRHMAGHLGHACGRPLRCCLSLNYAAEALLRSGNAQPITAAEAMRILEDCKQAGLAQLGENVRHRPAFICNCCRCCCTMFKAVNDFGLRHAIVSSNWIAQIDRARCRGCGDCAQACPISAIEIADQGDGSRDGKVAACREDLCLGCGVCASACRTGALALKARAPRVFTPETVFDRMLLMAVERGKLVDVLCDARGNSGQRALARMFRALEGAGLFKAALAIAPLRSLFLRSAAKRARRSTGEISQVVD